MPQFIVCKQWCLCFDLLKPILWSGSQATYVKHSCSSASHGNARTVYCSGYQPLTLSVQLIIYVSHKSMLL